MVTAQAQGTRVEDVSQRSETSRTFANPDGTWSTELATGPVRVQQEDGTWRDIDTTLLQNDSGAWEPRAAAADVVFSDGGSEPFVTMAPTDGSAFGLSWPEPLPQPVVDGATLTYPNAVPHGDLIVRALPSGFTHEIVLSEAPTEPVDYQLPLDLDGLQLVEEANGVLSVQTPAGKQVASAPEPLMWDDEDGPEGEPETVAPLTTIVDGTGADAELTLTPDMAVLQDPDTQYPVTIDPTFSRAPARDTWIQNADFTSGQTGSPELRAGTYDGGTHKARSFMEFDTAILNGKNVLSAELKLRNFSSYSCNHANIRVTRIDESWDKTNITWGNQPGTDPIGHADFAPAYGNAGCETAWATWNVESIVQGWANGDFVNRGFRIAALDEQYNASWRKYRSTNYYNTNTRPQLVVDYNHYPNKADKPAVSPGNPGYATTTTPTIKSTVSDTDGGQLRAKYTVTNAAGTEVWTGYSCTLQELDEKRCTSAGGTASVSVPAAAGLVDGATYTVQAWAQDVPRAWSQNASAATSFKVDTTEPSVTIKASAFTDGVWEPAAPASNTFTLTGSPDARSFEVVEDKASATTVTADSTGVGHLSWTVDSGWHTLKVTPYDKAGNKAGSATTFAFGVREPAFDTPHSGKGSLGVFRLEPQAPSGASSMTLSWRYADEGETEWESADGVTTAAGATWTNTTADSGSISTPGALLWDASQQTDPDTGGRLTAPLLLELQACFTYPTETACSDPLLLQLDDAFGPEYPTTDLGPATVALTNGHLSLLGAEAATDGIALGRVWSTSEVPDTTDGPFGRGWTSAALGGGASETTVIDNRTVDGTFVISYSAGGNEKFTSTETTGTSETFVPVDPTNSYTRLEHDTSTTPATLRLIQDTDTTTPTTTTWHQGTSPQTWVLESVDGPGTATDTAVSSTGARIDWISQVDANSTSTCTATTQAEGCRGLLMNYDAAGHITTVTRKVRAHGSTTTDSTVVATYTYTNNLLTRACGLDPDGTDGPSAPLCVSYDYDTSGTVPRLTSITEPGLAPWRYDYDPVTGWVTGVNRTLAGGTGEAAWAIDYKVALTETGLPDLSPAAAAEWGQTQAPSNVYAVYAPQVDGGASMTDPTQAQLYYTGADGTVTNTAAYGPGGWLVDTNWFDEYGNVVQTLDGAGWKRVQAAAVADRPRVARDASSFTIHNAAGDRVEEEYGPVTTATLEDGTSGPFRDHTIYVYDDEAPTLGGPKSAGGPFDVVVEETHAASDPDMSGADHDVSTTRYEYDAVVAGDGDGWNLRLPTRVKNKLDDGTWSTAVTRYDPDGYLIETRQPGGAAAANGAGSDAHSMRTLYYTSGPNGLDGACGNKPDWDGLACKTKPAAQPTGPAMPVTWVKSYTSNLQPAVVEETSGATVRTTTTTYDQLARPTSVEKKVFTDGLPAGPDLPARTITYNNQGQQATVSADGKTITTTYDTWGRPTGYTDALDSHSTTTYNPAGQVATFDDGAGVYAYTYTARGELRNIDVGGGGGTFTYAYTADGHIDTLTYPNGVVADYDHNEAGQATDLIYSQGTTTLLNFGATLDIAGRVTASTSTASAQLYTFDALGRLTRTQDFRDGGCITRTYGFDASSNRKTYASYDPDTGTGDCQTTTATASQANTFDSAGRITNSGYTYDDFGRITTIPKADTVPGAMGDVTATYHANDMIASLSQTIDDGFGGSNVTTASYDLDPAERVHNITKKVNSTETDRTRYRFANSSDSPSVVETSTNAGASWTTTRYISLPGLGMVASTSASTTTLQLSNLRGDTVATMAKTPGAVSVDSYTETDEYGNAITTGTQPSRYGWLGTHQRSTDTIGGMFLMGARIYNPTTGAFTTPDPVYGGNTTTYTYPQDPVNMVDLDGYAGYTLTYHLRVTKESAVHVFKRIRRVFTDVFPIPGARSLREGREMILHPHGWKWLRFPVRVSYVNSHGWGFDARPGHPDYPGGISFYFYRTKSGHVHMRIRATAFFLSPGGACLTHPICRIGYMADAKRTWGRFAGNIIRRLW